MAMPTQWIVLLALLLALPAHADWESYDSRQAFDSIEAVPHPAALGEAWKKIKAADLESLAQIAELFPEREIYFLGRDREYSDDLWRGLFANETHQLRRAHLINVSRETVQSPDLRKYLAQHGFDEKAIHDGKKFLLVDTGYGGSISRGIEDLFPGITRHQIATQLLSSNNLDYPSSRVALAALDPRAADAKPSLFSRAVELFESIPHATSQAQHFEDVGGYIEPMSRLDSQGEDGVSAGRARLYREDLAYFAADPLVRQSFEKRRAFWRELKSLETSGDRQRAIQSLVSLTQSHPNDPFYRAAVRDFIEILRLVPGGSHPLSIRPEDIGLHKEHQALAGSNCIPEGITHNFAH